MEALQAADVIYNSALQILSEAKIEPQLIPLVMGTVTQRLECFAIGAMAHELSSKNEEETEE